MSDVPQLSDALLLAAGTDTAEPHTPLLTKLCSSGGCAAKYAGSSLEALVRSLPVSRHSELIVGLAAPDDAAVLRLNDGTGLIFTVDFFPPIVDDPHIYGRISANNALSDIYAMGGRPALALSVAAFPEDLEPNLLGAIIAGAAHQCELAGAALAGGHTIRDREPKFGLAAIGFIEDLDKLWLKSGAVPGDALLITKPLGSGLIVTGQRHGLVSGDELSGAISWMLESHAQVVELIHEFDVHAVTDITGFGLLGHGLEIANRSEVRITFDTSALPILDGAKRLATDGVRTSGDERNRALVSQALTVSSRVTAESVAITLDPQTAGGLVVALPYDRAQDLERACRSRGLFVERIGSVDSGAGVALS